MSHPGPDVNKTEAELQNDRMADLFGDARPAPPPPAADAEKASSSTAHRSPRPDRERSPRREPNEGALRLAPTDVTPSFDGSLKVGTMPAAPSSPAQRSLPPSSPNRKLSGEREPSSPRIGGSPRHKAEEDAQAGAVESAEADGGEVAPGDAGDVEAADGKAEEMQVVEEGGTDEQALALPEQQEQEQQGPPDPPDLFYTDEQDSKTLAWSQYSFPYRNEDGEPIWTLVKPGAKTTNDVNCYFEVQCQIITGEGVPKDDRIFTYYGLKDCTEYGGQQTIMLRDRFTGEFVRTCHPQVTEINSLLPQGDREYKHIEQMLEEDKEMIRKRCKHIMATDLKEWLKLLLSDGEKQNLLFSRPGASFKKRFNTDKDAMRFAACRPFLLQEMTALFDEHDPIKDFQLDFGNGSHKSFVIAINAAAWTSYVRLSGFEAHVARVRSEADVRAVCGRLSQSTYDEPLVNWKPAMGYLRKLDAFDFTLEIFKKEKVGNVLTKYLKHEDRAVAKKAKELLQKYKSFAQTAKQEGAKVAEENESEMEDLF